MSDWKCLTWALRGAKLDRAETSDIAALAGFAGLLGTPGSEGVPAVIAAAIGLVTGALLACALFLRRCLVLFLFDELKDGTKTLVLGDRVVSDPLVLVEDGVGERDTLPAELKPSVGILIAVDILARQASRVRCTTARPVPDRGWTIGLELLQKPVSLPAAQSQNVCRSRRRHPALAHLAQHFDPVQLALAHQNPSHAHTLCLFSLGQSVTLLLCRCGTL